MSFETAEDNAVAAWFSTDFGAVAATLAGEAVTVARPVYGHGEDGRSEYDYVDVRIRISEYAPDDIDYKNDTLILAGVTWRYPKFQKQAGDTMVVRFRRNEKPIGFK